MYCYNLKHLLLSSLAGCLTARAASVHAGAPARATWAAWLVNKTKQEDESPGEDHIIIIGVNNEKTYIELHCVSERASSLIEKPLNFMSNNEEQNKIGPPLNRKIPTHFLEFYHEPTQT